MAERVRRGKQQFLIKWQGANPKTGRTWEPTWEPEDNANELLRASWAHKKAQTSASTTAEVAKNTKNKGRMRKQLALQTSRPSRQARMIESSADTSTIQSSPPLLDPSTPARESATPPAVSSTITTPVDVPAVHLGRLSRIPIPPRGSSFDPGDFDRFSQLLQSQPTTEQSCTQETDLDSSDLFATTRLFLSGIVPDSQSSEGEATFVPLTQRTNQSTITNESQEKDIIGDLVRARVDSSTRRPMCLLIPVYRTYLKSHMKLHHVASHPRGILPRLFRIPSPTLKPRCQSLHRTWSRYRTPSEQLKAPSQ